MEQASRILVVDDNRSLVNVIEGVLRKAGYQVLTAFDGDEGLRKARAEKPDLIVLDIVMPNMNGYEVCRQLHHDPRTSPIPIVMLTVKGQIDDPSLDEADIESRIRERMTGFEVGAMEFLSKPVKAAELLDRIHQLLWFARV
jgi:CheY-like chemotaxis protein